MIAGVPAFTASRDLPFKTAAAVIRQVQETEHRWFAQGDPKSAVLPWMPFQPADFLSIVFECVPELNGHVFLDVGCGPGTKMQLASHFFGFDAWGVEIDPAMVKEAEKHGQVVCADALKAAPATYAFYDLIWLYRPFRDPALEDELEKRIMAEMKPGAILAGGAWENCPADSRWITVVDDWGLRRGAWMKPRPVSALELP